MGIMSAGCIGCFCVSDYARPNLYVVTAIHFW